MEHQEKNSPSIQKKPQSNNILTSDHNMVAIYTVLSILLKMKNSLGLEAMLEYIGKYLEVMEVQHPGMKEAVAKALSLISVEKIYKEAGSCKDV